MRDREYVDIINNLLAIHKNDVQNEKDLDQETQKQIIIRDEKYSELLVHFVDITEKRNESKEKNKWHFFHILMWMLGLFGIVSSTVVITILVKCDAKQIIRSIPTLVTSITGFASTIIAIPLTITKYLFSTDEDKYITQIISHTQEHDLSSRTILKSIVQELETQEDRKLG